MTARCEGLLAAATGDLDEALARLEHALVEHDGLASEFDRARTLLHRGIVLRRLKRRRAARDSLAAARATFERLGSPLWVERAAGELARISGASRVVSRDLTATELRVAELVVAGHANKQVAAELYITVRTVESNLTSVYRKLGIRSRSQLAAALNAPR